MRNSDQKQRGGFSLVFAALAFLVVAFLYNPSTPISSDFNTSNYGKRSLKEIRRTLKSDKKKIRRDRKIAKKERKEFRRSVRAERMSHYH